MTYEPTMNLRFVERVVSPDGRTARFLQQQFTHPYDPSQPPQWEDVPCERLDPCSAETMTPNAGHKPRA